MAVKRIHSFSAIATDTTVEIEGNGAHSTAAFFVHVTAEGGSGGDFTVEMRWSADGTSANSLLIAVTGTLSTTGLANAALQAPFTTSGMAIPEPNLIVINEGLDGSTWTGHIYAIYGD